MRPGEPRHGAAHTHEAQRCTQAVSAGGVDGVACARFVGKVRAQAQFLEQRVFELAQCPGLGVLGRKVTASGARERRQRKVVSVEQARVRVVAGQQLDEQFVEVKRAHDARGWHAPRRAGGFDGA